MLKKRIEAADKVAEALRPAERNQMVATADAARCLSTALDQHLNANLHISVGLDAISLLLDSMVHSIKARETLARAHGELAKLPDQIGLRVVNWGTTDDDCSRFATGAADTNAPAIASLTARRARQTTSARMDQAVEA